MASIRSAVAVSLTAVAPLVGCGSSTSAGAKVQASYSRLLQALASHDAATVCELMLPVGQDQPRSALITAAHRLATPSDAAAYRRYLASCAAEFTSTPDNFRGYYDDLHGSRLGAISVHSPIANVAVTFRNGRHGTATFVDVAGKWRLVIGVD
jgi:hypothetical protein